MPIAHLSAAKEEVTDAWALGTRRNVGRMTNPVKKCFKEWKTRKPKEKLFMVGGGVSLALAIVGIFLPIVPQVPFAILAAYLFSKGSPALHNWIRENKYMGKPVCDWEDHRVVRPKLKMFSVLAMFAGAAMGHWRLDLGWAIALDVAFAVAIVFVVTRKSKPPRNPAKN